MSRRGTSGGMGVCLVCHALPTWSALHGGPHRWHPDLPPRPGGCPSHRVSEALSEADLALGVRGFALVVLVSPGPS